MPIASYIERESVDNLFQQALEGRRHIVIFGSSKQGKTSLLKKHIREQDRIVVNCSPESTPEDLYRALLNDLGAEIQVSRVEGKESGSELASSLCGSVG